MHHDKLVPLETTNDAVPLAEYREQRENAATGLELRRAIAGKVFLVTGGTGSIGSEVVKQLLQYSPKTVRVYSRDEYKQFELQRELSGRDNVRYMLGDVRDGQRLRKAMSGVDVVFHCAALKHVPACEYNPFEAVRTNVIGAQNVVEAALAEGVQKCIGVSTDKAVNPINVMGATKLLAEKILLSAKQHAGSSGTRFAVVRFGNVLGSRGSVIDTWRQQHNEGKPLTITSPECTRYIMSIPDAVGLVLCAMIEMRGGETFVLKMPKVNIIDLVREQFGNALVDIIGLRPGEKLHEELISQHEWARAVETRTMWVVRGEL